MDLKKLSDEFPKTSIHWRAQSVTRDGKKAMALAYIDARDVMERLDEVCGPENWQDKYECLHNGVVVCSIGIHVSEGVWIWKSDGAGQTDVEPEKGQISDAFKRAAVKWGCGRYLYDMPAPWVACESYEVERQGRKKWVWKKWLDNPWFEVERIKSRQPKTNGHDAAPPPRQIHVPETPGAISHPGTASEDHEWRDWISAYTKAIQGSPDMTVLAQWEHGNKEALDALASRSAKGRNHVKQMTDARRSVLAQTPGADVSGDAGHI